MKLLTKTTIYHVLLSILIFTLGGIITHQIVTGLINEDLNQYFERIEERIMERLAQGDSIRSRRVQVLKTDPTKALPDAIQDTVFFNGKWNMPVKKKIIFRSQNNQHYRIAIYKSFEEADDELEAVKGTVIYLGMAFLVIFILFNYFLSRSVWQPFYHTLRQIKDFNIHDTQPLQLRPTRVREFKEMNAIFAEMADKIRRDYHNLKEFTENTTHEIQTPLAIIKSKLELLMETGVLDQDQSKLVASAYQSTSKLSKLSRALTLITRIENQEFAGHIKELDLSQTLNHCLETFEDLIELKKIELEKQICPSIIVEISPL
ncbi:MAG: HAMP domain-containing sensor histidine kinase, partial [Bacteroidota bacterium]